METKSFAVVHCFRLSIMDPPCLLVLQALQTRVATPQNANNQGLPNLQDKIWASDTT